MKKKFSYSSSDESYFMINSSAQLGWESSTASDGTVRTNRLFRDVNSWYHIVLSMNYNTGNYKFFSNGKEVTSDYWPTSVSMSHASLINSSMYHTFGVEGANKESRFNANAGLSDVNLANIHFIDGATCSADYFGKYKNGKWVAKEYEGGYGTNGFRLDFAPDNMEYNSGNLELVKDSSGNGNHWTAST